MYASGAAPVQPQEDCSGGGASHHHMPSPTVVCSRHGIGIGKKGGGVAGGGVAGGSIEASGAGGVFTSWPACLEGQLRSARSR
mmetsp:Transcript_51687/g.138865  ORF Transcript_51687/g.138865 Transcript_51687/m.138865 type:complete len:83 (+) Transcript_51687:677-925(+)